MTERERLGQRPQAANKSHYSAWMNLASLVESPGTTSHLSTFCSIHRGPDCPQAVSRASTLTWPGSSFLAPCLPQQAISHETDPYPYPSYPGYLDTSGAARTCCPSVGVDLAPCVVLQYSLHVRCILENAEAEAIRSDAQVRAMATRQVMDIEATAMAIQAREDLETQPERIRNRRIRERRL